CIRSKPLLSEVDSDVFFFSSRRRHTRLQGDWSSDVCSSDLFEDGYFPAGGDELARRDQARSAGPDDDDMISSLSHGWPEPARTRSEERRVGKECRSRWARAD